ncbi:unnamed protein product [Clonostachys chloroleuca]|uniref:Uncharacterized protein n=1 Tax=Clonostachys chloroleuca TaxID=1926264 RepID=A0AA35QEQ9_9HYPO|nr:unnamed protein product [Clonostachys chloroleuca]
MSAVASGTGGLIKQCVAFRPRPSRFRQLTLIPDWRDSTARFSYFTTPSRIQRRLFSQKIEGAPAVNEVEEQNQAEEAKSPEEMEKDTPTTEKWQQVIKAIENTTKESLGASPPFDVSSPAVFQTYWRDVFRRLQRSVVTDNAIPEFLTDPPVKKFSITFMDVIHGLGCACCHPDEIEANVTLENATGVTKADLMYGVIEQLYGEKLPRVYTEPGYLFDVRDREPSDTDSDDEGYSLDDISFTDDSGVVVYETSWISAGGQRDGNNLAYSEEPQIYFYCCKAEKYHEFKGLWNDAIEQMNRDHEEARNRANVAVEPT